MLIFNISFNYFWTPRLLLRMVQSAKPAQEVDSGQEDDVLVLLSFILNMSKANMRRGLVICG